MITNSSKSEIQRLSYDAGWGRRHDPDQWSNYSGLPAMKFDRGYTGHEHLDMFGLINMNARLYDPLTGRFLSPDPYVQDPGFSQAYNRYSYALNNPMMYTDPDGEFVISTLVTTAIVSAVVGGVTNVIANWDNINGFWQGFTTFTVGAGVGAAIVGTAGTAGVGFLGVAGVAAAGGAATGVNNRIVAQTGHNFSGFDQVDWGQVGVSAAVGGASGLAGAAAGNLATNLNWTVNGVSHPLVKSAVVSPIAAGAGHVAGGTTAGLFQGLSLTDAFGNSFDGIGKSMAVGGVIGVGTTAGMKILEGTHPITNKPLNANRQVLYSGKTIDKAVQHVMSDENKIKHLFAPKHNLEQLVNELGGQSNTVRAVLNAANGHLPSNGVFQNISVGVNGHIVVVRGNIVNGIPRIGTMFIE